MIRLEEKESELKREYSRLHDRYTELFKTHVDYMERTKLLVGSTERLENTTNNRGPSRMPSMGLGHMTRSSGPLSYGFQSLEQSITAEEIQKESPTNGTSLRSEMLDSSNEASVETSEKSQAEPVHENKMNIPTCTCFFDIFIISFIFDSCEMKIIFLIVSFYQWKKVQRQKCLQK